MPKSDSSWIMRVVLIVVAALIIFVLISYYNGSTGKVYMEAPEKFTHAEPAPVMTMPSPSAVPTTVTAGAAQPPAITNAVIPSEPLSNEDYKAVDFDTRDRTQDNQACFPRDKLTADDLLPKDAANSKWAQVNPAGQGDVKNSNFLTAGYHIGVNTVGQTLRNPNYQLRSEPPNPRAQVSPWNQSTIEYDSSRRFLEVGEC